MAKKKSTTDTTSNASFEAKLWAAADALRNNMDAAEYKHVVLGLIFLKYISDAFAAKHAELAPAKAEGADPAPAQPCRRTSREAPERRDPASFAPECGLGSVVL